MLTLLERVLQHSLFKGNFIFFFLEIETWLNLKQFFDCARVASYELHS